MNKYWQSKLTKEQVKHCNENHIYTKKDMAETRQCQNKMRAGSDYPNREVCYECRAIAIIMGVEN